jgi:DNA repair exonuclease SbcCD ATPase subunit
MRLLLLVLKNFQGISSLEMDFGGNSCAVYGANGAGKTTLANSWTWLTHGKDIFGRSKFDIRPQDKEGNIILEKEVSVSGLVKLSNGRILELRKVIPAFADGLSVDHSIDKVPMKQKEYDKTIETIFPYSDEVLKTISSPTYFCTEKPHGLGWEGRRRILHAFCRFSDEEIVAAYPELIILPPLLEGRSIPDQKKVWTDRKKKLDKEKTGIPSEIKGKREEIVDLGIFDIEATEGLLKIKQGKYKDLLGEGIVKAGEDPQLAELREVEAEIDAFKKDQEETRTGIVEEKRATLDEMLKEQDSIIKGWNLADEELSRLRRKNNETSAELQSLRIEFKKSKEKGIQKSLVCPTCQQSIPESMQEEAKKNHLLDLNKKGALIKAQWEEEDSLIKGQVKAEKALKGKLEDVKLAVDSLQKEITKIRQADIMIPHELTEKKKQVTMKTISEAKPFNMDERIEEINAEIAELSSKISQYEQNQAIEKSIEELKKKESGICYELEEVDHGLTLIGEWEKTKASLIERKVNSRFKNLSFRMFRTLGNGREEECCDPMIEGVSYGGSLNGGAKVNAGLEVIDTLSRFWESSIPIFVDSAESVDEPYQIEGQVILLIDDKKVKNLTLETMGEEEE